MSSSNASTDELDPKVIRCPNCEAYFVRVGHSPLIDAHRLYCDRCGNSVEVDYYDVEYGFLFADYANSEPRDVARLFRAISDRLRVCDCGGTYRIDAPRRCHKCSHVLVEDAEGLDIYPHTGPELAAYFEGTSAEQALYEAYEAKHIRQVDIWR